MAGAQVVAVVGRYVRPEFSDDTRALWDAVMSETFTLQLVLPGGMMRWWLP